MDKRIYSCVKCNGAEYTSGELRTTGSGLSRFLNIQNQKYSTVICVSCGYTELYRLGGGRIGNIVDFLSN